MAGSVTYKRVITGTLNGKNYSIQDGCTVVVNNGWVNDYSIAAATWTVLISSTTLNAEWVIGLINKGANAAVYRIKIGSDVWRFNLPAGKARQIVGQRMHGTTGNDIQLAVYSASGTDIQLGFFT